MNALESAGSVTNTPKVSVQVKAPEVSQTITSEKAVETYNKETRIVTPNTKKHSLYNQYEREANNTNQEKSLKQFRHTLATYLARSQGLIEQGDVEGAVDHITNLMQGFSFSEKNPVVVDMFRILNFVQDYITTHGLTDDNTRKSLSGIIRNLKEGFMDE